MRYEHLKNKSDVDFRRLTGVTRQVFDAMTKVVDDCKTRGRPHSLSCQDQVLVCLEYLRTYKTQLELSADYGISESNINRTIIKVENALIKSGQFNLPKRTHKPTHQDHNTVFEYVIIDVSEVPCQRPKKSKNAHTVANKNSTP